MGRDLVLSKIDRVFYYQELLNKFDNAWVDIIPSSVSDHRLLCLHIDFSIPNKKIPFRHFNAWTSLSGYEEVVKNAWEIVVEGCPMYQVVSKLKNVKDALIRWNKKKNGDMYDKARELRALASAAQAEFDENPDDELLQMKLKELRLAATEAETVVESYLRQKSRCIWLHDEDRNSRFFYVSMKTRNRNVIKCVEDGDVKITLKPDIEKHITSFYKDLYYQEELPQCDWKFVDFILKLAEEDIKQICKWVTTEEIEHVVNEAKHDKAPRPDGFNSHFFKHN